MENKNVIYYMKKNNIKDNVAICYKILQYISIILHTHVGLSLNQPHMVYTSNNKQDRDENYKGKLQLHEIKRQIK